MSWKQVKVFTADGEQSAIIESNPEETGLCLVVTDENDNKSFVLYMTYEEARVIGQELIRYANDVE